MKKNLLTMDNLLAKEIKYHIQNMDSKPNSKLPSERELAEYFHVQRPTIRNALNLLIQEGCIHSIERKGYFISPNRITQSIRYFSSSQQNGLISSSLDGQLFDFQKLEASPHLSGKMLVPSQTPLFKIVTIYSEHHVPVSIDSHYIPVDIFPSLTLSQVESKPILDLLRDDLQVPIAKSNQKVTLIYTNELESQLLNVAPGTPMMKYKGLVYDHHGRLITFFERIMRMDRFAFIREAAIPKSTEKGGL